MAAALPIDEQIRHDLLVVAHRAGHGAVMHTDPSFELVTDLDRGRLRLEVHDRH